MKLDLVGNFTSEDFMRVLMRGRWLVLKRLSFMDCVMDSSAVSFLLERGMGWASLESLKHMSELVNFESEVLGAI